MPGFLLFNDALYGSFLLSSFRGGAEHFSKKYSVDKLVWYEIYDDPVTAITRERELKKWRRDWKIRLIEKQNPQWIDLYPQITV
ncbi:GIY-YIG nuclease family protein [Bradyrhizobium manausense]|uniref:GIY-YIG nuclease family protein n=1 Tax=Bradyrhizobium manausense TaxID=989370 RepID=UPI002010F739|nr:GIY-YIG nuclease family protein [Bradyrhizobium manausense]